LVRHKIQRPHAVIAFGHTAKMPDRNKHLTSKSIFSGRSPATACRYLEAGTGIEPVHTDLQ
jgi:hypothetical protein